MKQNRAKMIVGGAMLALVLIVMAVAGVAQEGRRPGGRGFGGPGGPGGPGGGVPFLRDLNLTDAQKTQIKQITDSFEESTKGLHEQMRTLHESQMNSFKDGAFDEAAVRAAAQARAKVQVELEVAQARMMSQVFGVLTAEQKAQLEQKRQEFEQRRQERETERGSKSGGNQ